MDDTRTALERAFPASSSRRWSATPPRSIRGLIRASGAKIGWLANVFGIFGSATPFLARDAAP